MNAPEPDNAVCVAGQERPAGLVAGQCLRTDAHNALEPVYVIHVTEQMTCFVFKHMHTLRSFSLSFYNLDLWTILSQEGRMHPHNYYDIF